MYLDGQRKNTAQDQRNNKARYRAKNQTKRISRESANECAYPNQDYREKPI